MGIITKTLQIVKIVGTQKLTNMKEELETLQELKESVSTLFEEVDKLSGQILRIAEIQEKLANIIRKMIERRT